VLASLAIATLSGCKKSYNTADVEGVLKINGQPGHKVRIQFVPDVDAGTKGPSSIADTDSHGRFKLLLAEGDLANARPGAVVGHHCVALTDLQLAESPTGRGVPIRFKSDYALPGTTPLRQEVKDGQQTIEINIP
jgi:hypothetical protein